MHDFVPKTMNIKRSRFVTLLSGCVLTAPCLSYAILADAPLIPVIAIFFLLVSFLLKSAVAISVRAVVYTLTISFLVPVVLNELYPVDNDRFFIPLPTEILFPFVITLGVCATYFVQTSRVLTTILTASAFAMVFHGSCVTDPANTRLTVSSTFFGNRFCVFGLFLALQMTAFIPLLYYAQFSKNVVLQKSRRVRTRVAIYTGSVISLVTVTVLACQLALKIEYMMDPVFNRIFSAYIGTFRSKIVFSKEIDLYRKVDPLVQRNVNRIVLRAKSESPPGYLRGRVYSTYADGHWKSSQSAFTTRLELRSGDSDLAIKTFYRSRREESNPTKPETSMDVLPARYFYSDVLLASGHTERFDLIAEALSSNDDGVVKPKDWDQQGAYILNNTGRETDSAYNGESLTELTDAYTDVAESGLKTTLTQVSSRLSLDSISTDIDKVARVVEYLTTEFEYSLEGKFEVSGDPVNQFLTVNRAGHCELFASAAALMLRIQGIPTRYVTGFVCMEPHPNQDYWIARLGDCHAWVEAWIQESQKWILVEATPAIGIPSGEVRTGGRLAAPLEQFTVFWKSLYAQVKRGYFAQAVFSFLGGVGELLFWLFRGTAWYIGWGGIAIISGVMLFITIRRGKRQEVYDRVYIRRLNLILADVETYLRRFNVNRAANTTVRDLINRIGTVDVPNRATLLELLDKYEALRYSPIPPDAVRIEQFSKRVAKSLSGGD